MARDEAILQAVGAGRALPTLRLYAWDPPCISLGYGQKASDVDFSRAAALGWDVVRRPTGGRAILHTDELTYSVALPAGDTIAAGDVVESYRRLSRALVAGLEKLGVRPQADRRAEGVKDSGPVCFEMPSHYEITVGGRKLIGSAQVRRQEGILQHGSLPLCGDLGRINDALVYPDETARESAKPQVRARAATLEEALRTPDIAASLREEKEISWRAVAEAMVVGFAETFEIVFERGELSDTEQAAAERLAVDVYGSEAYTRRR
ncbi:MAG: lipoate--protein ligase family protein [Chloroflexi bacterium]|nr:lipoate--protein ligase family protein [Chloroflexota bacterium]